MPFMLMEILLSERSDGVTRLTVKTLFPSVAAMEQFISMGMEEGLTQAISQIDALL
jgi:sorbitol-specific phosphotransferase system component IIC